MGAKHKLNNAHLNGAVLLAGLAGLLTDSVGVFAIALLVLIGAALASGEIRT